MKDNICESFQNTVANLPTRHKSILDILTKLQDSGARINRAVIKSATSCGCLEIHAFKQEYPDNLSLDEIKNHLDDHVDGTLCSSCRDAVENELGNHMFYLAGLANTLNLSLYDILLKEAGTLTALGKFNLR